MSTHGNLLFGLYALQNGAVDPDRLAETCAMWASDPQSSLADQLLREGCLTVEQKSRIEELVQQGLNTHGGDVHATLAADMDGRYADVLRQVVPQAGDPKLAGLAETLAADNYEVERSLQPREDEDDESRARYSRTHLHAKGGMGQVWVARDSALGRQIALKELRPEQSDNALITSRFLYEARVTAQLEHPGIVPVYEMGGGQVPFYTMRFVKGRTLCEATRAYHKDRRQGKATSSVELVKLLNAFVGVCHAVAFAHSRGYIHRDLKGQNVMLGDFGEVIVLDWGIAKQVGPEAEPATPGAEAAASPNVPSDPPVGLDALAMGLSSPSMATSMPTSALTIAGSKAQQSGAGPEGTMMGQLLGTPSYMSPEQAEGRVDQLDRRTDVYGLGAILYEILAGQPPFGGKKTTEILHRVRNVPPRAPREFFPEAPVALQSVCLKAIAKRKEDRYASATELAQEVERYLADEPVLACPEPWTQKAMRWARRHRTLVASAAALLAASTLALGVGTVLVTRERNEATQQGQQARQAVSDMYMKVEENWLEDRLDPLQKEFLEKTLTYYESFTSHMSDRPEVRLEHGRAHQRMGDIQRKLGRLNESEQAFRKALAILEPLRLAVPSNAEVRRALVLAQTRLGDLQLRRGRNEEAESLFSKATEIEKALAGTNQAEPQDHWLLGRTLKSQADLLRRKGAFAEARPVYQQAIAALEKASAATPAQSDIRNDLAVAQDALGLLLMELGESHPAEAAFRDSLKLLEQLVATFPTVPRFREALAKANNSVAMIEQASGRWADSERHYRMELKETERLSQDFPDRPEFRRELARASTNLGSLLAEESQLDDAEAMLTRGITLNSELHAADASDLQVRFDLARCQDNMSFVLNAKGKPEEAITAAEKARDLSAALENQSPDTPRYRSQHASSLLNLGHALERAGKPEAETTYAQAVRLNQDLSTRFPANVEYRVDLGRALNAQGALTASLDRPSDAEKLYERALTVLDIKGKEQVPAESLREQAAVLSNLGELRRASGRPGAGDALRRSIQISTELTARKPPRRDDRLTLAIAENNLAEVLEAEGKTLEATQLFTKSIAGLDALAAESPRAADTQNYLGYVHEQQGKLLARSGQAERARNALQKAVDHQRLAVELTDGKVRAYQTMLVGHLGALAEACLRLSDYDRTITTAIEVPKAAPGSGNACFEAARILARCVAQAGGDGKLGKPRGDALNQKCLGRIVVLLREAVDMNPGLAAKVKAEPSFTAILARPEFKSVLGSLVELALDKTR